MAGNDGSRSVEQDTDSTVSDSKRDLLDQYASRPTGVGFPWEADRPDGVREFFVKSYQRGRYNFAKARRTFTVMDWLATFIPCLRWLRVYNIKEYLWNDIVAGLSVGFMVVPQGMSYANTAGLPSVYGLYGAFLPVLAYSILGSSRQLAVGPVAITSLLIATNLKKIVEGSADISNPNKLTAAQVPIQEHYNHCAIQLAFIVSIIYTLVGVFQLGFLTNFLSHSVIGGFTSGAAIIIGLGQFKYIVGYSIKPAYDRINLILDEYFSNAHQFRWQDFIFGMMLIIIMVAMRETGKRSRRLRFLRTLGPITACIIGLCAVYIGKVDQVGGLKIVGAIPSGLPKPTVGWWFPMKDFNDLFPVAIVVFFVDLLESSSIARALAAKNKYELAMNREILGLGLANFVGACFNAYTTTGSFSRSSVNNEAGAKSGLAQFVCAWVVAFVLLFLTPVFAHIPFVVLGSIVVTAVSSLFEYEQAIYLFKTSKLDFLCWLGSFFGTLFYSVEIGLAIAIGLAVLITVYHSAFPHTAVLGRIPGTSVYRNIKQYADAQVTPGLLVVRVDSPIYFANIQYLKERFNRLRNKVAIWSEGAGVPLQFMVLDLTPCTHMDATATSHLLGWISEIHAEGLRLVLSNPSPKTLNYLQSARVDQLIGHDYMFVTVNDAVIFCQQRLAEAGYKAVPIQATEEILAITEPSRNNFGDKPVL